MTRAKKKKRAPIRARQRPPTLKERLAVTRSAYRECQRALSERHTDVLKETMRLVSRGDAFQAERDVKERQLEHLASRIRKYVIVRKRPTWSDMCAMLGEVGRP